MPYNEHEEHADLILACEDFSNEEFLEFHCFFAYEENILAQLMAHGPVLLKGGRGTGKSALLREAARRLNSKPDSPTYGIYMSLRHLPLLRSHFYLMMLHTLAVKLGWKNFLIFFGLYPATKYRAKQLFILESLNLEHVLMSITMQRSSTFRVEKSSQSFKNSFCK